MCCARVEFLRSRQWVLETVLLQLYLAKVHALDAFATKCWTNGRRGRGLSGADDELDDYVFGHGLARHDWRLVAARRRLELVWFFEVDFLKICGGELLRSAFQTEENPTPEKSPASSQSRNVFNGSILIYS